MFHIFFIHAKGVCLLTVVVPEDIPCWMQETIVRSMAEAETWSKLASMG